MLSSILHDSGCVLPSDLLRPSLTNTKGFYESWHWVNANDKILKVIGLKWDSVTPTPKAIETGSFIKSKKDLVIQSIVSAFSDCTDLDVPVIKDPRICRTFPIWENALQELGFKMKLLMPIRHPFEVIHSLVLRDGLSPLESCYVWIWNVVESIIFSKEQVPKIVLYDKVLQNPTTYLSKILPDVVDEKSSRLVDNTLNHNSKARGYYNKNQEPFLTAIDLFEKIQESPTPSLELIEFCTKLRFHSQYVAAKESRKNKRMIQGLLKNSFREKKQKQKNLAKEILNHSFLSQMNIKNLSKIFSFLRK